MSLDILGRLGMKLPMWVSSPLPFGADNQALARRGALADPLPDREDWLNPDDVDVSEVPETSEVVVEVSPSQTVFIELISQVDESWLLSADDLAELEKDFM
jgi:hypothetical protein